MAVKHIDQNQTGQFDASTADTTWIIDAGVTMMSGNDFGFKSDFANTKVVVRGIIDHSSPFGSGVALYEHDGGVRVAKSGKIASDANGVYLANDDLFLVNAGSISGGSGGVVIDGSNGRVTNGGEIITKTMAAVALQGLDGQVVNAEGGLLKGVIGIRTNYAGSDGTRIENHGTIEGDNWAFDGGSGADHIINRGEIIGSVSLGDGQNIFDTRGGTVAGDIAGGADEDIYLISDAAMGIFESAGNGYDMLRTTVSYLLDANNEIEVLTAIGKGNIDLTANGIGNRVNGNRGKNMLDGLGGADWLDGRKGKDVLTGGADGDHFIFRKGGGSDIVTDFNPAEDILYVQDFYLDKGYKDLLKHMEEDGGNLVITIGKDSITLEGILKGELEEVDITFANT
jgi:Ca2+-binding RTX toxin-like protein